MRRWGIVITTFYAIVLLTLLLPTGVVLTGESWPKDLSEMFEGADVWIWAALLVMGQALLFVPVDRSWRKLRPRTHHHRHRGDADVLRPCNRYLVSPPAATLSCGARTARPGVM